jgi:hypothetical protein
VGVVVVLGTWEVGAPTVLLDRGVLVFAVLWLLGSRIPTDEQLPRGEDSSMDIHGN